MEPDTSTEAADALKVKFEKTMTQVVTSKYRDIVDSDILNFILAYDTSPLVWAPARVVADLPYGEVSEEGVPGPAVLGGILIDAMHEAGEEFILVSPYFVPTKKGVESFRLLRDRGGRCLVLTNSLASTDVIAVYGGYKDYQKVLLEMGVELWELKPYADYGREQRGAPTDRRALHAKVYSIDRQRLFVGSFNWNPRSRNINTEMGILIESPELAERVSETLTAGLPGGAWKLRLSNKGEVEWLNLADGKETIFDEEPETDSWRRFRSKTSSIDGLEDQL